MLAVGQIVQRAGRTGWLIGTGAVDGVRGEMSEALARAAHAVAIEQRIAVPGEEVIAQAVSEIAVELPATP